MTGNAEEYWKLELTTEYVNKDMVMRNDDKIWQQEMATGMLTGNDDKYSREKMAPRSSVKKWQPFMTTRNDEGEWRSRIVNENWP